MTKLYELHIKKRQGDTGLSPATERNKRYALARFENWYGKDKNALGVNRQAVDDYIYHLRTSGMSHNSVTHYIVILKAFFKDCTEAGYYEKDPAAHLKIRYRAPQKRHIPDFEDLQEKLLIACGNDRDRVIVRLLMHTGLRRAELVSVKWSDISEDGHLTVKGKGDKVRHIPLSSEMRAYLDSHRNGTPYVIVNRKRPTQPLAPDAITVIIKKLAARVGLKTSPHDLRHAMASRLIELKVSPKVVQERLGHSDVAMTMRKYVHPSNRELREAAELV